MGSEAVLVEIEELASSVGAAVVRSSGCLGNCSQAPNAIVVSDGDEKLFAQLRDLSCSTKVVEHACGRTPNLGDDELVARLQRARRVRMRMQARDELKWNMALSGLAEEVAQAAAEESERHEELMLEHVELLAAAGLGDAALELLSAAAPLEDLSLQDIPKLQMLMQKAEVLARLGRVDEIEMLRHHFKDREPSTAGERRIRAQVLQNLSRIKSDAVQSPSQTHLRIQGYARWRLHSINPVSKHSAVYHFRSNDEARGNPIRSGRGGRTVWSKTWHTTLLAEVGKESNSEGPLPWIERDYTPISTAQDWVAGRVDLLVKIYEDGAATSWLHRVSAGGQPLEVWMSQPMRTMYVPSLTADESQINRTPQAGVLLLLAGTGVVTAAQVLHHTNAATCFGNTPPLRAPVSVVYCCRSDDTLMIPNLVSWCKDKQLKQCVVFCTESLACSPPFPDVVDTDVAASFAELGNASCLCGRLSIELLQIQLDSIESPVGKARRIVVSGPAGFNKVAKQMLDQCGVEAEAITILEA
jgi:ferredoxin-NADP reductase